MSNRVCPNQNETSEPRFEHRHAGDQYDPERPEATYSRVMGRQRLNTHGVLDGIDRGATACRREIMNSRSTSILFQRTEAGNPDEPGI